jgi:hypothetical protein
MREQGFVIANARAFSEPSLPSWPLAHGMRVAPLETFDMNRSEITSRLPKRTPVLWTLGRHRGEVCCAYSFGPLNDFLYCSRIARQAAHFDALYISAHFRNTVHGNSPSCVLPFHGHHYSDMGSRLAHGSVSRLLPLSVALSRRYVLPTTENPPAGARTALGCIVPSWIVSMTSQRRAFRWRHASYPGGAVARLKMTVTVKGLRTSLAFLDGLIWRCAWWHYRHSLAVTSVNTPSRSSPPTVYFGTTPAELVRGWLCCCVSLDFASLMFICTPCTNGYGVDKHKSEWILFYVRLASIFTTSSPASVLWHLTVVPCSKYIHSHIRSAPPSQSFDRYQINTS